MKDYLKQLMQKKGLRLTLLFMVIIVCLNAILVIYYRSTIIKNSDVQRQIQDVRDGLNLMDNHIRLADMGVRAYIIKSTQQFLEPYIDAKTAYLNNLDQLKNNLANIGYDINNMKQARDGIVQYMQTCQLMVDLCRAGKNDDAISIFEEDRGNDAWEKFYPFVVDSNRYIGELSQKGRSEYKKAINLILALQIILILLSVPILIAVYQKILKSDKFIKEIFGRIIESNKTNLFDNGKEANIQDENSIINSLVVNLNKTSEFIKNITRGNYNIEWEGMDKKVTELNKSTISGELINLKVQLSEAKNATDIRSWTTDGLTKFSQLIREYESEISKLSDVLISGVIEYLGAQQGGLFFLNDIDQNDKYLELMGCYAYQRKKFIEKRIEIGQGLVGQCFLEKETTLIKNIPDDYVSITSGLGDTNPTELLVVPLKQNDEVVGVIEIASIKSFENHHITFVEKLSEMITSAIATAKRNDNNRILLEQSQQQAEEMRAQEEEMRQNMEELQATQEQMHRKNEEVELLLKQASENEEGMKLQMEELKKLQKEADDNKAQIEIDAENFKTMFMEILNEVPQKIFLKDANGIMYLANQKAADAHGKKLSEIIGTSDYDMVDKETADSWKKKDLEVKKNGAERYSFEAVIGGKKSTIESYKKVFNIRPLNENGILGIQHDITDKVNLEERIKELEEKLKISG